MKYLTVIYIYFISTRETVSKRKACRSLFADRLVGSATEPTFEFPRLTASDVDGDLSVESGLTQKLYIATYHFVVFIFFLSHFLKSV